MREGGCCKIHEKPQAPDPNDYLSLILKIWRVIKKNPFYPICTDMTVRMVYDLRGKMMRKYILFTILFTAFLSSSFPICKIYAGVLDVFDTEEEKAFKEVYELIEVKDFEKAKSKFASMREPVKQREKYNNIRLFFEYIKAVDDFNRVKDAAVSSNELDNLYVDVRLIQSNLAAKPLQFSESAVGFINNLTKEAESSYMKARQAIEDKLKHENEIKIEAVKVSDQKNREKAALEEKATRAEIHKQKDSYKNRKGIAEEKLRKLGLRGIYPVGISRFLYDVSNTGNLEKGLNFAFWNEISDQDKKLDKLFKSIQKVDGHILYMLSEWSGSEQVTYTIIVKPEKDRMFLEAQRLNYGFLKFTGNVKYTNTQGIEKTVPYFEEISIE